MKYDDPIFLGFMAALRRNMELTSSMGVVGFVPWLKYFLPKSWTGVNLMEESVRSINSYLKVIVLLIQLKKDFK